METIIVISVLCVILVVLYGAYFSLISKVQKKNLYDNTEYVYKASVIRDYLEDKIDPSDYEGGNSYTYCSNLMTEYSKCFNDDGNNQSQEILKQLDVYAIYITPWEGPNLEIENNNTFEATTLKYIKSLDPKPEDGAYRIIVMFKSENDQIYETLEKENYQYASLRFGSRG